MSTLAIDILIIGGMGFAMFMWIWTHIIHPERYGNDKYKPNYFDRLEEEQQKIKEDSTSYWKILFFFPDSSVEVLTVGEIPQLNHTISVEREDEDGTKRKEHYFVSSIEHDLYENSDMQPETIYYLKHKHA